MSVAKMVKTWVNFGRLTKSPASLNQCNLWVVDQERDGSPEKVGLWPEICVENSYVFAVFNVASLQPFFESAGLVPSPGLSDLIYYVYAFVRPSLAFHLHHLLQHNVVSKNKIMKQLSSITYWL